MLYIGLVDVCMLKFSRNRCSLNPGSLTWMNAACENADSVLCADWVT